MRILSLQDPCRNSLFGISKPVLCSNLSIPQPWPVSPLAHSPTYPLLCLVFIDITPPQPQIPNCFSYSSVQHRCCRFGVHPPLCSPAKGGCGSGDQSLHALRSCIATMATSIVISITGQVRRHQHCHPLRRIHHPLCFRLQSLRRLGRYCRQTYCLWPGLLT